MFRVTHTLRIAENAFCGTLNNGLWFLSDVVGIYELKETQIRQKESESAKQKNAVLKPASAKKFLSRAKPCGSCCSPPVLRGKDRGEGALHGGRYNPPRKAVFPRHLGGVYRKRGTLGLWCLRSGRCAVLQLEVLFSWNFRISGYLRPFEAKWLRTREDQEVAVEGPPPP